jgi:predicted ABC-type ATPase
MKTFGSYLAEAKSEKSAAFAFGRMNPMTSGHEQLVNKLKSVAKEHGAEHHLVLSHSHDPEKNPLTADQKLKHAKRAFPDTNISTSSKEAPSFMHHLKKLSDSGVKHLHIVAGSDRLPEYKDKVDKYNGKKDSFKFKSVKFHSAGERDPDAEGTAGMSGSKMRAHAAKGEFDHFRKGVSSHMSDAHAKELYHDIRHGMGHKDIHEAVILDEGVHDPAIFKAVFLAGGPGSGKDYILSKTMLGLGLVEINSDRFFEHLLKKNNLSMLMPDHEMHDRNLVRGRAKNININREQTLLGGRMGLIINTTADNAQDIIHQKKILEELGYDTMMVFVYTDNQVSMHRNIARGKAGGRTVPEDIRRNKWIDSVKSIDTYKHIFSRFHYIDNSVDVAGADTTPMAKEAHTAKVNVIWKSIMKFTKEPVTNPIARAWMGGRTKLKEETNMPSKDEVLAKLAEDYSMPLDVLQRAYRSGVTNWGPGSGTPQNAGLANAKAIAEKYGVKTDLDEAAEEFLEACSVPTDAGQKGLRLISEKPKKQVKEVEIYDADLKGDSGQASGVGGVKINESFNPKVDAWLKNKKVFESFSQRYGSEAHKKMIETAYAMQSEIKTTETKTFAETRRAIAESKQYNLEQEF